MRKFMDTNYPFEIYTTWFENARSYNEWLPLTSGHEIGALSSTPCALAISRSILSVDSSTLPFSWRISGGPLLSATGHAKRRNLRTPTYLSQSSLWIRAPGVARAIFSGEALMSGDYPSIWWILKNPRRARSLPINRRINPGV